MRIAAIAAAALLAACAHPRPDHGCSRFARRGRDRLRRALGARGHARRLPRPLRRGWRLRAQRLGQRPVRPRQPRRPADPPRMAAAIRRGGRSPASSAFPPAPRRSPASPIRRSRPCTGNSCRSGGALRAGPGRSRWTSASPIRRHRCGTSRSRRAPCRRPAALPRARSPQAEAQFQRIAASRGTRAAYAGLGARDLRIYRHGQAPRASLDAALASPAANEDGLAWTPERVETATSGDFGYARGRYARAADPNATLGYFMRAWRREAGGWRIVIDVANPAR